MFKKCNFFCNFFKDLVRLEPKGIYNTFDLYTDYIQTVICRKVFHFGIPELVQSWKKQVQNTG